MMVDNMRKIDADEMVRIFQTVGIDCDRRPRPGTAKSWSVSFIISSDRKDDLENILIKYDKIKCKLDQKPHGLIEERIYLY